MNTELLEKIQELSHAGNDMSYEDCLSQIHDLVTATLSTPGTVQVDAIYFYHKWFKDKTINAEEIEKCMQSFASASSQSKEVAGESDAYGAGLKRAYGNINHLIKVKISQIKEMNPEPNSPKQIHNGGQLKVLNWLKLETKHKIEKVDIHHQSTIPTPTEKVSAERHEKLASELYKIHLGMSAQESEWFGKGADFMEDFISRHPSPQSSVVLTDEKIEGKKDRGYNAGYADAMKDALDVVLTPTDKK